MGYFSEEIFVVDMLGSKAFFQEEQFDALRLFQLPVKKVKDRNVLF